VADAWVECLRRETRGHIDYRNAAGRCVVMAVGDDDEIERIANAAPLKPFDYDGPTGEES